MGEIKISPKFFYDSIIEGNLMESYVHVYTGDGKGKTTAALGVAIRTLCVGKKVYCGQFLKDGKYSEYLLPKFFPLLTMVGFGPSGFIHEKSSQNEINIAKEMTQKGFETCKKILKSGEYDLVILDEINIAIF